MKFQQESHRTQLCSPTSERLAEEVIEVPQEETESKNSKTFEDGILGLTPHWMIFRTWKERNQVSETTSREKHDRGESDLVVDGVGEAHTVKKNPGITTPSVRLQLSTPL